MKKAQIEDDSLSIVMAYCDAGSQPDHNEIRTLPEEAKHLLLQWNSLHLKDNMLYRKYHYPDGTTQYLQLILPGKIRRLYVERLHAELGHFGEAKTCEAMVRRVYFPGWRQFTKLIVKTCTLCQMSQRGRQALKQTPLRLMQEFRPMAVLHADLLGPIPADGNCKGQSGFQYILTVIDAATRYLWLLPLRNKTADLVATAIVAYFLIGSHTGHINIRLYQSSYSSYPPKLYISR